MTIKAWTLLTALTVALAISVVSLYLAVHFLLALPVVALTDLSLRQAMAGAMYITASLLFITVHVVVIVHLVRKLKR